VPHFSSEVEMEGPKKKWGPRGNMLQKNFAPELGPSHFQFVSYAYVMCMQL